MSNIYPIIFGAYMFGAVIYALSFVYPFSNQPYTCEILYRNISFNQSRIELMYHPGFLGGYDGNDKVVQLGPWFEWRTEIELKELNLNKWRQVHEVIVYRGG
jgi:hypothetical protein